MRNKIILIALAFCFTTAGAQNFNTRSNKGRIFASYGVNRTAYDLSTLRVAGDGYDFSLTHFDANDGFESLDFSKFNARLGVFVSEQISISVGYDNFTYQNIDKRLVKIEGTIDNGNYAGTYYDHLDVIKTDKDFLQYGYTQLNYVSLNISINDDFWVSGGGKAAWSYYFGFGGGALLAESNTLLFSGDDASVQATTTDNGVGGFAGNANFGTRLHLGPIFLELGGKAGYMRTDDIAIDDNGGLANHKFLFASGIGSVGLSFKF